MAKKAKLKPKAERVSTIQETRADIDPQLAKVMNPAKFKWDHYWWAEPKLDGLRCIVVVEHALIEGRYRQIATAYSRNGKPLWNLDRILNEILGSCSEEAEFVLDGEAYTQDWNLSMSIVKRSTQSHEQVDKLRYHVWDYLTLREWQAKRSDVSNDIRRERLFSLLKNPHYCEIVRRVKVSNSEELQTAYHAFLEQGYEGAILKNPEGGYELGRRSPHWLKIKPWFDADLSVIGCYAGEGKHLGRIGGLVLEGDVDVDGRTVHVRTEVGTGFTDAERDEWQARWESNTHRGRIVEIKYQEITVDGACRFPVYNRLREDKE